MAAEPLAEGSRSSGGQLALRFGLGLVFLAIALRRVFLPIEVATTQIDASGQRWFGEFFRQGARAGVDYVYTFGPLGFLYGTAYDPEVFWLRVAWSALYALCWTGGVGLAMLLTEGRRRRALLLAIALFLPPSIDAGVSVLLLTLTLYLVVRPPHPALLLSALGLALVLSLIKFTYLVAASLGAAAVLARLARDRGLLVALGWGLGGLGAGASLWCGLGQQLGDLPAYLATSLEIARGYSEAMAFAGHGFFSGCAALGSLALAAGCALRVATRPREELLPALLVVAWTAMAFKHGCVRQDGHVLASFLFLALAPFLCWRDLDSLSLARRRALAACLALALSCGVIGTHVFCSWTYAQPLPSWPAQAARQVSGRAGDLLRPERLRGDLEERRLRARLEHALPRVRAVVGAKKGGVDLLNVQQGLLFLNDLPRQNRPVLQGYVAFTPALARRNAEFFASARAPEFVLLDGVAIDAHLPTLDDGAALLEVLRRYELVLVERGLSLLRRRSGEPAPRELLWERTCALGEEVQLPPAGPGLIQLELDVQPSALGRLRRLVWRAAQVDLEVRLRSGEVRRFRLIPGLARAGFLIDPLPLSAADLAALANGDELARVAALRVVVRRRRLRYFSAEVRARAWRVPLSAPPRIDLRAAAARALGEDLGVPASVPEGVAVEVAHVAGFGRVVQVHAPGRLELEVPGGARRLSGRCGLRPAAGQAGGSDGVAFSVEQEGAALWSRQLDPARRPADRGPQSFSIELPPGCERLTLFTRPGPTNSWDWSYWAELRFLDAQGARIEAE